MLEKVKKAWNSEKLLWQGKRELTNRDNIIGLILYILFWIFMFSSQHYQSVLLNYFNSIFSLKTSVIIISVFRAIVLVILFMESGLRMNNLKNEPL